MTQPVTGNATSAPKWKKWRNIVPLVIAVDVVIATLAWFIVSLMMG
jgi:hypothetical protein